MEKILAITNQKGGVGKTTTAVNLAASLSDLGKSVLLIDMDPQGSASIGSGVKIAEDGEAGGLEQALLGVEKLESLIRATDFGYKLLPSNAQLNDAELSLIDKPNRERRLMELLAPVASDFQYIIIDCSPSLGMLTVNSLVAADGVIVPVQCEYYALEGLALITKIINSLSAVNPRLAIAGLLRTMFDARNNLAGEVSRELETYFGEAVYHTVIPRSVRLAEAPGHGKPALFYDRYSTGAQAYLNLAREVVSRVEG